MGRLRLEILGRILVHLAYTVDPFRNYQWLFLVELQGFYQSPLNKNLRFHSVRVRAMRPYRPLVARARS